MSKIRYRLRSRERRREVVKRNAEARAKRTPEQQIARLDAAGHIAARERARLESLIHARQK